MRAVIYKKELTIARLNVDILVNELHVENIMSRVNVNEFCKKNFIVTYGIINVISFLCFL